MKKVIFLLTAMTVGAAVAAPTVSNVALTRDETNHVITVAYDLSEKAIVTATFSAGGTELSPETVGPFGGEISRELAAGSHIFFLRPQLKDGNAFWAAKDLTVNLEAWPLDCPPPYMAVNLLVSNSRRFYPSKEWVPGGVTNRQYKLDTLLMRKVLVSNADGYVKWPMGNPNESNAKTNFKTRYVTLTNDYYVAVYETTQRQYRDMLPGRAFLSKQGEGKARSVADPPNFTERADRDVLPMEFTTWHNLRNGTNEDNAATYIWPQDGHKVTAKSWIGLLRARAGIDFDLPTEAQWEYACRGGTSGKTYGTLDDIAWTPDNWQKDPAAVANGNVNQVHEVGLLTPNNWGLYDMLGNVNEQCLDYMPNDSKTPDSNLENVRTLYYAFEGEIIDPVGPGAGEIGRIDSTKAATDNAITAPKSANRPRRGGHFSDSASTYANAYYRIRHTAVNPYRHAGFRLVCPATFE